MTILVFINILILLIIFIFLRSNFKRTRSLIDLGNLFALSLVLNYPLRTLQLTFFRDQALPEDPRVLNISILIKLSCMIFIGLAAFCFGYYLSEKNRYNRDFLTNEYRIQLFLPFWIVFYSITLLATIYKVITSNYVSFLIGGNVNILFANTIENIHTMGWFCFAAVWLDFWSRRYRGIWPNIFFLSVNMTTLAYQIMQGSKTFLMLSGIIIILSYYLIRKKIPIIGLVIFLCWTIFFVFPFVSSFRDMFLQEYKGEIPQISSFISDSLLREAYENTQRYRYSQINPVLSSLSRFAGTDHLYIIDRLVPEIMPYRFGKNLFYIIVSPIPRILWPSKPIVALGGEYGKTLNTITSVTPFPLGEMYWNGGIIGIVFGMFLWGVCLSMIMSIFAFFWKKKRYRLLVIAIYISRAYWLTTCEGTLVMMLASLLKWLIAYSIITMLAFKFTTILMREEISTGFLYWGKEDRAIL